MVEKKDEYLEEGKSRTRLINEYKKYGSLVVGFDFDNYLLINQRR